MQDLGRGSFGLRPVGQVNRKGDDEFVAVEPCHNRLLRDNADDRRSGLAEHFIARFIAMPVVDRLEAMQPNRRDAPAAATCRKSLPQLFAAVAQTFAIGRPVTTSLEAICAARRSASASASARLSCSC